MTMPLVLVAQATTMPPPPAPHANHSVSAFSILLVVVIVLGSVAMIALSSRRFRRRPASAPAEEAPPQAAPDAAVPVETDAEIEATAPEAEPQPVDPKLLARLRRVTGAKPSERRKLGNRKPGDHPESHAGHEPAADSLSDLNAESGERDDADLASTLYPEPIPIRRRAAPKWQDEPVFAASPDAGRETRVWSVGNGAAMPGLTSEEMSQLEAPRQVSRVAQPLPRLKPEVKLPKLHAAPDPDELLLSELGSTVRELLFCANAGDLLHGFALYSDPFLFRTMDDSGLNEEEFREAFANLPAKPVAEWTRLAEVRDLERIGPDLVAATVVYAPPAGAPKTPPERFRFLKDHDRQNWLIDDIAAMETAE